MGENENSLVNLKMCDVSGSEIWICCAGENEGAGSSLDEDDVARIRT